MKGTLILKMRHSHYAGKLYGKSVLMYICLSPEAVVRLRLYRWDLSPV